MIVSRRPGARSCAVLVAVLSLSACVGPSRTDRDYSRKAGNTAEAMRSEVETGRLVAELVLRDRAFGPFANIAVTEAEEAAGSIAASFDSVQPPSTRADDLRSQLDELLVAATSALGDLRIAVRRHRLDDVKQAAADLADVSAELEPLVGV